MLRAKVLNTGLGPDNSQQQLQGRGLKLSELEIGNFEETLFLGEKQVNKEEVIPLRDVAVKGKQEGQIRKHTEI